MAALDYLLPDELLTRMLTQSSSSEVKQVTTTSDDKEGQERAQISHRKLMRTAVVTFIGMAAHNCPEGAAVYIGTLQSTKFATSLAISIACHNIPEVCKINLSWH